MEKNSFLTQILKSKGTSTLLGGDLPENVITCKQYISPLTSEALVTDRKHRDNTLDGAIHTALGGEGKKVLVVGPEGTGKTTALLKAAVDWAKGEHLQNFSYAFYFRLGEINPLQGATCLETLLHRHGCVPQESVSTVLQKPEDVLFIFDDLDVCKRSLDPSGYAPCRDPSLEAPAFCLVASLIHGWLMSGASFLLAARTAEGLESLDGVPVNVLGFLKPQRELYFKVLLDDQAVAAQAVAHMEKTLGFYDFSAAPRFCWTVCRLYKSLMGAGEKLPETLSQLCVAVLARLIQMQSPDEAGAREQVSALGELASHCIVERRSGCTRKEIDPSVFQGIRRYRASLGAFLQIDGDPESEGCVFSFRSQLLREFLSALRFFLSPPASVDEMLEKHGGRAEYLDFFMSALSEPSQRGPLEKLLGEFDSDQIRVFKSWFENKSKTALAGYFKDQHLRCFRLLHQSQNEKFVKEVMGSSAGTGISYGELTLQDCVALAYVVSCLGEMETLNLYLSKDLTGEKTKALVEAMTSSRKILLSNSFLRPEAVPHLVSALRGGITRELDLSHTRLGDEKFKILHTGLRDSKLQKLNLAVCGLTEASCEDLASVLTSAESRLCVLHMSFNPIGDRGFTRLCQAFRSPRCTLRELQLQSCQLTWASMEALSAVLCSGPSELRNVNLMQNQIDDRGAEALCRSLQQPFSKIQTISVFDNGLTDACCAHWMKALMSEHCSLAELDLSVNDLGQEGALLLCKALGGPRCVLRKLSLNRCMLTEFVFKELGSLLTSGNSQLKSLSVGLNKVGDQGVKHLWDAIKHPGCLLEEVDLEMTGLTDACVEDLLAAIKASKTLRSLELRNNSMSDRSVPALVQVMQDSSTMLEMNLRYNDFSEDVFETLDKCDKIRY